MKRMQIGRTSLLLAALAVASFAHGAQPAGAPPGGMGPPPGMGGPGGPGGPGGFGGTPTPALPAADVPDAVKIARPTAQEVAQVRAALDRLASSDQGALLKKYPDLVQVVPPRPENSAIIPQLSGGFVAKHQDNLKVAAAGNIELLLMGDSITDWWRNETGTNAGKAVLDKYFGHWKIANFGIAGDTTQGVLYRLKSGEGKGFSPRAVMLMIGTNNTGRNTAAEIAEGIGAVVLELRRDFPQAKILLLGVFPRGAAANDPIRETIADINRRISKLHDGTNVHYLDISAKFLDAQGNIPRDVMGDALHPTTKGYEIWAEAVKEPLTRLMAR